MAYGVQVAKNTGGRSLFTSLMSTVLSGGEGPMSSRAEYIGPPAAVLKNTGGRSACTSRDVHRVVADGGRHVRRPVSGAPRPAWG